MAGLRVCIITPDIRGPIRNGGIGTACEAIAQVLADAGHEITILYARGSYSESAPIRTWVDHYAAQGRSIKLVPCPLSKVRVEPEHTAAAWNVWRWLRPRAFDVIYAVEWGGTAAFVALAKAQGLAFRDTSIITGVHSPTFWHLQGNRELPRHRKFLAIDHLERVSVGFADILVSPSQHLVEWLRDQNWPLPQSVRVLPNPVPFYARGVQNPVNISVRTDEIVFFGRLEPRKGLVLFAQAIRRIPPDRLRGIRITFLGKRADFDAQGFLRKTLPDVLGWRIIDDHDAEQATSYIARPGRIAVIASLIENSPMTVVECIGRGVPFLASAVGGIPELLCSDDRNRHLFAPHPEDLAQALMRALSGGLASARPLVDADSIDDHWRTLLHEASTAASEGRERRGDKGESPAALRAPAPASSPEVSVVLVHRNRPKMLRYALAGLRHQTFQDFEVILVDDGSDRTEAQEEVTALQGDFDRRGWRIICQQNRYLGAARNTGWKAAKGRFVLFHDDDNVAMPAQLEMLVGVARYSGADILTSAMATFSRGNAPAEDWEHAAESVWIPLGGCIPLGLLENCFGDAQALVRRSVLEELGGFTEDYGLGHEDWELFARAVISGYQLLAIPEPLFWYRLSPDSMLRARAEPDADFLRSARPYLDLLPPPLQQVMLVALADERQRDARGAGGNPFRYLKMRLAWYATHPDRLPQALRRARVLVRSGGLEALWANLFAYRG
jgi:glycosyltransferase involved in cell wall biosynthesis